jgi:hypothetical protein
MFAYFWNIIDVKVFTFFRNTMQIGHELASIDVNIMG